MDFVAGGRLVKHYRKRLGITQAELGMKLIDDNTISRIEKGKVRVKPLSALLISNNLNQIAKQKGIVLNVTVAELMETKTDKCKAWCEEQFYSANTLTSESEKISAYDQILQVALDYGLSDNWAMVNRAKAEVLAKAGKIPEAKCLYMECYDYYREHKPQDIESQALLLNRIGNCSYTSDADEACAYYSKAYEILNINRLEVKGLRAKLTYNLALYYAQKEFFNQSIRYILEAKQSCQAGEDLYIRILILESNIKLKKNEYKEAIATLEALLKQPESCLGPYLYIIYNNLGICYSNIGEVEKCMILIDKSIRLSVDSRLPGLTSSLLYSAKMHIQSGKYDIAKRYLDYAVTSSMQYEQHEYTFECYYLFYICGRENKNLMKCLEYLNECKSFCSKHKLNQSCMDRLTIIQLDYELCKKGIFDTRIKFLLFKEGEQQ